MANDVLNPFPAILIHNLIIISISIYLLRHRLPLFLAIGMSFLTELGISLFWRQLSFTFERDWIDLLYRPVFELHVIRKPSDEAYLGFVAYWILPLILSSLALIMQKRIWSRRQSLRNEDNLNNE